MSAFILSDEHISYLVNFASLSNLSFFNGSRREKIAGNETAVGQLLLNENYKSVNYRYELNDVGVYHHTWNSDHSPVQVLKACNSYDYQSCETPDYKDSVACRIIHEIRMIAIQKIQGYDQAEWEIKPKKQAG